MILFFLIVFLASMENLYAEIFFIGYNNERMESFVRRWTESHIKSDCKKKKKKKIGWCFFKLITIYFKK